MIFISSSCVKFDRISDSVRYLASKGFMNIELSGGTRYYTGILDDLKLLKEEFGLNYLIHNYFPPPQEDFVVNLASINNDLYQKSIQHFEGAISLGNELGVTKIGMHAGFFIDPNTNQLGKQISNQQINDVNECTEKFIQAFNYLSSISGKIELYIENNVLSSKNYQIFNRTNPFMLVNASDYFELKKRINFSFILDIAHLKVSCKTLGLDFHEELSRLINQTHYVHVSDNDSFADTNNAIEQNSELLSLLTHHNLTNKIITLEVYKPLKEIKQSLKILENIIV